MRHVGTPVKMKAHQHGKEGLKRHIERIEDLTAIVKMMHIDEETRHDRLNSAIYSLFPFFLVACCVISAVLLFINGFDGIEDLMLSLCQGFVIGFIFLGIPTTLLSDKGVMGFSKQLAIYLLVPIVVGATMTIAGYTVAPWILEFSLMPHMGSFVPDLIRMCIEMYIFILCGSLAINAVITVVVAYLSRYMGKIYLSVEDARKSGATRGARLSEAMFQVPDIIDVEDVELEPFVDQDRIQWYRAFGLAFTMFMFGTVICSNIFLNPYFIEIIPYDEMVVIGVLLSMFLPVLIFPWQITEAVGAKVKSKARDYYLWKGLKNRLYQSFFTVAVFVLLIFILIYLGIDFSTVAYTYLAYLSIMGAVSLLYAFIYYNRHYVGFKSGVAKNFYTLKEAKRNEEEEETAENTLPDGSIDR
jgi:hypothetical protein